MGLLYSTERQCYAFKDPHNTKDDIFKYYYLDNNRIDYWEKNICSKCIPNFTRHMENLGHSYLRNEKI